MIDIIQQIINNTQFQYLQGNDSLHVCILEQLLKLSEICSYKYQFITIIEIIQKHFKLSNDQDLYIKASTQLILLNSDLTGKYIDDLTQFQEYNIKSFALLGNFLLYLFGRKQSLTGEHFRAIETLSTVIVRDRKNSDNYYQFGINMKLQYLQIGIALYYDEQYEEALAAFDISQKLNYNIRYMLFIGLQIIQILGSCYYQLKCYILPLSWINRVLNLSPQNKDALFLKCNICKQKEYIQSNDFGCNLKEIVEIRYKIQTLDIVYLERYNQSCKILQSQFNEFNSIFDINMAILISKYCPIKFFEPQEFEGQIQQGKFSQYMKTIKVQPHPQLLKSEQDNDNDNDFLISINIIANQKKIQGYHINILKRYTLTRNQCEAIQTLSSTLNFYGKIGDSYYHFYVNKSH
ncbi:hypothetical protein pb186bvf_002148 [Paramecium bursaria]